jgi:hypothetical protein
MIYIQGFLYRCYEPLDFISILFTPIAIGVAVIIGVSVARYTLVDGAQEVIIMTGMTPSNNAKVVVVFQYQCYARNCPTEWLRGSGGAGEAPCQLLHILANRACAERQSRCPTGAGVGLHFLLTC